MKRWMYYEMTFCRVAHSLPMCTKKYKFVTDNFIVSCIPNVLSPRKLRLGSSDVNVFLAGFFLLHFVAISLKKLAIIIMSTVCNFGVKLFKAYVM